MKKILALTLCLCMVLSLAACGSSSTNTAASTDTTAAEATQAPAAEAATTDTTAAEGEAAATTDTAAAEVTDASEIEDTMTSDDGTYEIAFVTDVGQLKDKSFNQGTYDGVKLYAYNHGLSYKYYQPANGDQATDDDRYDAMAAACNAGAKVVVCAGYMQGTALAKAAAEFPDVNFVFIDGWAMGLDNCAGIAFKEQECGYFAGYAVVKEGFTKLGFCGGGGGTNPACCRYGYGFVQGANAAAAELGETVDVNYTWLYGASFQASPELQTLCNGWYEAGTEVIFSCGGSIFQSITAAASANDGYVIGVDTDQSYESDTVITSALKGIGAAAQWAIGKSYDGTWAELDAANTTTYLGASDGATGLPTDTWSLENYTVDEYQAQLQAVIDGTMTIADDALENGDIANVTFSNVNLTYVE